MRCSAAGLRSSPRVGKRVAHQRVAPAAPLPVQAQDVEAAGLAVQLVGRDVEGGGAGDAALFAGVDRGDGRATRPSWHPSVVAVRVMGEAVTAAVGEADRGELVAPGVGSLDRMARVRGEDGTQPKAVRAEEILAAIEGVELPAASGGVSTRAPPGRACSGSILRRRRTELGLRG